MLWSQVKKRRCAVCYRPVVLKMVMGQWKVVCLRNCQPGGHVSEGWVDHRRMADMMEAAEVASNYPELVPEREPLDIGRSKETLFG